ncbi:TonB-dependent receptor [Luteimonas salinilitoris]|uniref:TonB-dependent receptor n=1 Tax=Luteimonas salinilitoris TaxID=3237697 RepID=A0ABV4HU28_9GAMM
MQMKRRRLSGSIRRALVVGACAAMASAPAWAQQDAASATDGTDRRTDATELDGIVVTGRVGTGVRTKAETSYSVTNIEEEALRLQAPTSVTESLKSVPGFWVEASGGEASGNVRVRGIPVDGFGSVNILEDGVPVVHDPSLGYLNGDQAFRLDETIERIEVVRGGPSSVIYPNAPAGAINYIPRQVGDEDEGIAKVTVGDYGLQRLDFWYGTPVAGDWKLGLGGFYRQDDGIRDPGYTANDGGQFRVNLAREFERGRISIDAKHLDDKVMLYLGIPMSTDADGDIRAVPGFDGHYGTVAGPETRRLAMPMDGGGVWDYDNAKGTHVRRDQLTVKFDYDLGAGWQVSDALGLTHTKTTRNGVFALNLQSASSFLENQADALASRIAQVPGAAGLQLSYANAPGGVFDVADQNGNGLMMVGGLRGVEMPVKELVNDLRLSRDFDVGGQDHNLTLGYYYANTNEDFDRYSSNVLLDAQDNARLLDLDVVDADGNVLATLTEGGVSRHGYEWGNASGESTTHALYLADEWQVTDALRIDAGVRWEEISAEGWTEVRTTADGGTPATASMLTGSGRFLHYDISSDKVGWTLGANYQFGRNSGLFGRWTSAFRLPSLGSYVTRGDNACDGRTGAEFDQCVAERQATNNDAAITQTMDLAEIGYKYSDSLFSLFATGFYTKYDNVGFSNYVFDNNGVSIRQQGYASTRTYGLELEGGWYPADWFDLQLTATLQNPEYRDLKYTEDSDDGPVLRDFVGNRLIRVPETSLRLVPGVNLLDGRLRLQVAWEYQGDRYVDTANSVKLPAYDVFNASARFEMTPQFALYGYVDNLGNSLGLTEGNPRAGELQSGDAGANSFIARPVLGRAFRLAVMYRF